VSRLDEIEEHIAINKLSIAENNSTISHTITRYDDLELKFDKILTKIEGNQNRIIEVFEKLLKKLMK